MILLFSVYFFYRAVLIPIFSLLPQRPLLQTSRKVNNEKFLPPSFIADPHLHVTILVAEAETCGCQQGGYHLLTPRRPASSPTAAPMNTHRTCSLQIWGMQVHPNMN